MTEREKVVVSAGASLRARIFGACVCASTWVHLHLKAASNNEERVRRNRLCTGTKVQLCKRSTAHLREMRCSARKIIQALRGFLGPSSLAALIFLGAGSSDFGALALGAFFSAGVSSAETSLSASLVGVLAFEDASEVLRLPACEFKSQSLEFKMAA